ncbi:MAG TPA: flavin reductase [Steroidobacteraceae bacterium]|nr:flavin reductase [Steroidobacteraceae bacterium]
MNLAVGFKLLGGPAPMWAPIALPGPQDLIEVHLLTPGADRDVTNNQAIAALAPFSVVLGGVDIAEAQLSFRDRGSSAELGRLQLRATQTLTTATGELGVYAVIAGAQTCEGQLLQWWHRLRQALTQHRRSAPDNFRMSPAAVRQMLIFYLCPRPVVLVSVDDGTNSNLFPMDLIGPVSSGGFTLALRNTSPSVATIQNARRVALADVAARDRDLAYGLGRHHRQARIDWAKLPYEITHSARFGLPVPARALRVRECEIDCWHQIGSHTLFVGRVVSEDVRTGTPYLFHTSGIHRHYRERHAQRTPWLEARDAPCT